MIHTCHTCYGTGTCPAERFFLRDEYERPITGPVECRSCGGRGSFDTHYEDWRAHHAKQQQITYRKLIDLGGSPYSDVSRFFDITEVIRGTISSVYFSPKALLKLLGLVFPTDQEAMTKAVKNASWSYSKGWRVVAKDNHPANLMYAKKIERQLWHEVEVYEWPEMNTEMMRDDRQFVPLRDLKLDLIYQHKGSEPITHWRVAVEAVRHCVPELQVA